MEHCRNFLGMSKMRKPMIMTSLLLVVAQVDLLVPRYDTKNRFYMKLLEKLVFILITVELKESIFS